MGASLYYKINKSDVDNFNTEIEAIKSIPDFHYIDENKGYSVIDCLFMSDLTDAKDLKKKNPWLASHIKQNLGKSEIKVSSTDEVFRKILVKILVYLNTKFEIKYWSGSCAFDMGEDYFSREQQQLITNFGALLSDSTTEKYHILKDWLQSE